MSGSVSRERAIDVFLTSLVKLWRSDEALIKLLRSSCRSTDACDNVCVGGPTFGLLRGCTCDMTIGLTGRIRSLIDDGAVRHRGATLRGIIITLRDGCIDHWLAYFMVRDSDPMVVMEGVKIEIEF